MANKPQEKLIFYSGYGKNFRELRKRYGLTLAQMGEKVHFSDKTINLIETEKRTPTIEQLNAYCKEFNASLDYLTGRTKTLYADIAQICEVTGLSESAVNVLQSLYFDSDTDNPTQERHRALKMINTLLVNNNSIKLFNLLSEIKEISMHKRYHEQIINKILNEYNEQLLNIGVTEQNYSNYSRYSNCLTGDKTDVERAVAVHVDKIIIRTIDEFLKFTLHDSDWFFEWQTDFELLYNEPQMLREYKVDRIFNDIIADFKSDYHDDKQDFYNNNLWIFNELCKKVNDLKDILEKDRINPTKSGKEEIDRTISELHEQSRQEMIHLVRFLKDFEDEYLK